ncbi:LOW QUALITY PROTEIN: neurofilament heavy polypeptide [Drosophila tropicalis]|uniref:LOW QUALITY PROTEIN: neurofilament heavy polypeptide n=1 Tax=Drosophila tropicalis TaxID=46794 RepID=UPI0035AC1EFE
MSSNRVNRYGRDFLQENKQKVAHWETNGRLTAAAAAKRVNLWRPVVKHYSSGLRPFGHTSTNTRTRNSVPSHESGEMHSGLAQPYGFFPEERPVCPPTRAARQTAKNQKEMGDEKVRQGGGYSNRTGKQTQIQTQSQAEDTKDSRFAKKSLAKSDQQQAGQLEQVEQPPTSLAVPKQTYDEDDALSVYSMRSKASRRSNISKISKKSSLHLAGGGDEEAPLSARSNSSLKTVKSAATVRSTCSVKSRATIKSVESVKSQATLKSHMSHKSNATIKSRALSTARSEVSRRSVAGGESSMPQKSSSTTGHLESPCCCHQQSHMENERLAALNEAHYKYGKLIEEYNHMPVSEPTLRVRNRKIAIERELDQLDYAINMYDHAHMHYRR